jgi:hypothetical protein
MQRPNAEYQRSLSGDASPERLVRRGHGGAVKTYVLYVYDRRSTVPSMDVVTARRDARARQIATQRLASSIDHFAAEVWEADRLVCRLDKPPGSKPEGSA